MRKKLACSSHLLRSSAEGSVPNGLGGIYVASQLIAYESVEFGNGAVGPNGPTEQRRVKDLRQFRHVTTVPRRLRTPHTAIADATALILISLVRYDTSPHTGDCVSHPPCVCLMTFVLPLLQRFGFVMYG